MMAKTNEKLDVIVTSEFVTKMAKIVEETYTEEDYKNVAWPGIQEALFQILNDRPKQFATWSFEKTYTFVMKCMRNFQNILYNDLLKYVENHLQKVNEKIQISSCEPIMFVKEFQMELFNYMESVKIIVCVFTYMDTYYVTKHLKSTMTTELYKLFASNVSDKHVNHLLSVLNELRKNPLIVPPSLTQDIIIKLHNIKPGYAQLKPQLFSMYIPNLFPPCSINELDHYMKEAKQLQTDLHSHPDFFSGDQSRKRPSSNDCNNYPQDHQNQHPQLSSTTFNPNPNLTVNFNMSGLNFNPQVNAQPNLTQNLNPNANPNLNLNPNQ